MITRSYLVKLSAGESDSSRVWNSRKPLAVGHPMRWVMEQSEGGVRIRGENEGEEFEHFVKDSEIEKTASVILGATPKSKTGLRLELRAVATVAAASASQESVGSSLRIFYCKDTWTVDSTVLTKSYVAKIDGKKIFKVKGTESGVFAKHDPIEVTSLVDGVTFNTVMKKGETRRLRFFEVSGSEISYKDSNWKLASFQKDANTNPFATGLVADAESNLFNRTLKGAVAALLLAGLITWFIPSAPVVAKKEEKIHILLAAKKKVSHGLMTAAPTGDPRASDISIGKKGVSKNAGKKGTRVAATKKVAPSGKPVSLRAQAKTHTPVQKRVAMKQAPRAPVKTASMKKAAPSRVAKAPTRPSRSQSVAVAKPAPVQHSELFKTLSSSSFRKTARSLVMGGASGSGKGSADSVAEARSLGTSSGSGRGALGGTGGVSTRSASVSGFGGGGMGDGDGGPGSAGAGYGRGSYSKVSGQGKSFVSMDTGASEVDEGLTRDQVGRVIHSHSNEIRYCYESATLRNSNLAGSLTMKFSINGPGDVVTAGIGASTVGDRRFHDCIVSRLKGWKFPKPRGGVVVAVAYPFMFKSLTR